MEAHHLPHVRRICREAFSPIYAHFALRGLSWAHTLVALEGESVVGLVELVPLLMGRVVNVFYLAVAKEVRRKGIGRLLVTAAIEWGAETGASFVIASVPRRNRPSLDLFTRSGFISTGLRGLAGIFGLWKTLSIYNGAMVAPHERILLMSLPPEGRKGINSNPP